MSNYEENIIKLYNEFISKKLRLDKKGITQNGKSRFATYPFIGSNYGTTKKILFIGLDIGSDENSKIQTIIERRSTIEHPFIEAYNPHIAGTYFLSLYFLRDEYNWIDYWDNIKNCKKQSMQILKDIENRTKILPLPTEINFMSFVALTNAHKFVTVGRTNRLGDQDRKTLSSLEFELLQSEIDTLEPDIICFQGKKFLKHKELLFNISKIGVKMYVGYHPSYVGTIREPRNLVKSYIQYKTKNHQKIASI